VALHRATGRFGGLGSGRVLLQVYNFSQVRLVPAAASAATGSLRLSAEALSARQMPHGHWQ
jgi:hypothetical protein